METPRIFRNPERGGVNDAAPFVFTAKTETIPEKTKYQAGYQPLIFRRAPEKDIKIPAADTNLCAPEVRFV